MKIVLPYLKEDDTLWQRYETDFVKFRFAVTNLAKMRDILSEVVSHNCTVDDSNLERLVALHYLAFSRYLDVAALEAVINPLQSIQMEDDLLAFSTVVEKVLVKGRKASQSDMAYYVIGNLFGSLLNCSEDSGRLQDWLKTCRSIVSFIEWIYLSPSHHIMCAALFHSSFPAFHSKHGDNFVWQ